MYRLYYNILRVWDVTYCNNIIKGIILLFITKHVDNLTDEITTRERTRLHDSYPNRQRLTAGPITSSAGLTRCRSPRHRPPKTAVRARHRSMHVGVPPQTIRIRARTVGEVGFWYKHYKFI